MFAVSLSDFIRWNKLAETIKPILIILIKSFIIQINM